MLSVPHMIVVFLVVLVVFGPQKLPELARSFGKLMAEFRKASNDFKNAFEEEMRDLERQARIAELKKQVAEANAAAAAATTNQSMGSTLAATQGTPPAPETVPTPDREPAIPAATELSPIVNPVAEAVPRETNNGDGVRQPEKRPEDPSQPEALSEERSGQAGATKSEPTPSHDEQQPA